MNLLATIKQNRLAFAPDSTYGEGLQHFLDITTFGGIDPLCGGEGRRECCALAPVLRLHHSNYSAV